MARDGSDVIRRGEVRLERIGKTYVATYEVLKGNMVRVSTGLGMSRTAHYAGAEAEYVARMPLDELIAAGKAEPKA